MLLQRHPAGLAKGQEMSDRAPEPGKPARPTPKCTAVMCSHTRGHGGHCIVGSCVNDVKRCPKHRNS